MQHMHTSYTRNIRRTSTLQSCSATHRHLYGPAWRSAAAKCLLSAHVAAVVRPSYCLYSYCTMHLSAEVAAVVPPSYRRCASTESFNLRTSQQRPAVRNAPDKLICRDKRQGSIDYLHGLSESSHSNAATHTKTTKPLRRNRRRQKATTSGDRAPTLTNHSSRSW